LRIHLTYITKRHRRGPPVEKLTAHYRLIAPARDEIIDVDMIFGKAHEWPARPESGVPGWYVIELGDHILAQRLVLHAVAVQPDGLEHHGGGIDAI
jgi:hypothetical protein